MGFFKKIFKRKIVGIDIGSDAIKIAEISSWGGIKKLENYGQVQSSLVSKSPILDLDEQGNLTSIDNISLAIKEVLKEANIKTKKAVFSLPDFLTFAVSFDIPPMPEKEIPAAIHYNASQYLTLPVSDVALDWRISPHLPQNNSAITVFLIAVPNQIIQEYEKIAKIAGLEIYALEAEVFGISRALVKNMQKTVCLLDIGARSSTINIIDKGFLKRSYSNDFCSGKLSLAVASSMSLEPDEAEQLKNKKGILQGQNTSQILKPLVDKLFSYINNIFEDFSNKDHKKIDEFYLTGGTSSLPGLKDYFSEVFKKPVIYQNCFSDVSHPRILEKTLLELSSKFSAAVGVASGILDE